MKKMSVVLGTITLSAALVACGNSEVEVMESEDNGNVNIEENNHPANSGNEMEENDAENTSDENSENNEPEEVEIEETVTIGDTISFDGLEITLNDAYLSEGNEFEEPRNDSFLLLDMTIANTNEESADISTFMQMSVQDDEGFTHDPEIYLDAQGSLDGEIGPGRDNRGEVAFDVNESNTYDFIFQNPFTSGQAIWTIEEVE
ncbi:DUF4352 domain-containing protein [Paenalkalicoccus suaedae]|uniref:DUF4352 domain-containing protein n=1 Tax=Paenalkalicoccus suaedae TaxID=2592382 RepID=A0A859FBA8_9BACI|nr:DUF4352 domain-containing protein [Paenalkalicoccus suaedae]QKS70317.1 DUF4352 domain-containing protein [Paenalkalicoccus suaedae]